MGVSLTLAPGELAVVLGVNGCGKSTMLRRVAGMLQPTSGDVRLAGQAANRLSGRALAEARTALAMIFQHARLVRRRSVVANVMTGALGRHRTLASSLGFLPSHERPRALSCLAAVGLQALAMQRADTLSGGQAQRVRGAGLGAAPAGAAGGRAGGEPGS